MPAVRIFQPAKSAMQSGRAVLDRWILEYAPAAPKTADPLMGWVGSADTVGQIRLTFASRDEAVAFARRHGLDFEVEELQARRVWPKNYADRFRYDRVQ
jgi:hypothetical protein